MMNNKNNNVDSNSTKNNVVLPHLSNIRGSSSGGIDFGLYHRSISGSSSNATNFDMRLTPGNLGDITSENYFFLGLP